MSAWKALAGLLVIIAVPAVTSIVIVSIGLAAYPGVLDHTAPVLCPDDRPDAFTVQYSTSTGDGTGTNYTLFCMDERGQFTEVGSWRPLGLIVATVYAVLLVLALALVLLSTRRRRSTTPA